MDGEGIYKFSDGSTYEGIFRRNFPDGHGKATYPGGTVYVGEWTNGYPHGNGKSIYQQPDEKGSIVYEGCWKEGRRDGNGILTYTNGSTFKGGFKRGRFHGKGTFSSKASHLMYTGNFYRGYVSGRCTIVLPEGKRMTREWPRETETSMTLFEAIQYIERQAAHEKKAKKEEREELLGPIRAEKLQMYVKNVRQKIQEKRENEKEMQLRNRRKVIREAILSQRAKNKV